MDFGRRWIRRVVREYFETGERFRMEEWEDRISLQEIVNSLKKRWLLFFVCPLVFVGFVFATTFSKVREYKSTAVMLVDVLKLESAPSRSGISRLGIQTAGELLSSLVPAEQVMQKFRQDAEPHGISAVNLWGGVLAVRIIKDTSLLHLSATTPVPALSRDLANYVAEQTVRSYSNYSQSDVLQTKKYLQQQHDDARQQLNDAESALLQFNKKSNLAHLNEDIRILLEQRSQLSSLLFKNGLSLRDNDYDVMLKERDEVLKFIEDSSVSSSSRMLIESNKVNSLLAFHRVISKEILQARSELSNLLKKANGDLRVDGPVSVRDESIQRMGLGDISEAMFRLQRVKGAKNLLENERKKLLAALPILDVEEQVSVRKLRWFDGMNDANKLSQNEILSSPSSQSLVNVLKQDEGVNGVIPLLEAPSLKIVDEKLRLEGVKEKKSRYRERILKIDSELLEQSKKLWKREVRYLQMKIYRMLNQRKEIESELGKKERGILAWQNRRNNLFLKIGLSPSRFAKQAEAKSQEILTSMTVHITNALFERLSVLDKGILSVMRLREEKKTFQDKLRDVRQQLDQKVAEKENFIARQNKLKFEYELLRSVYADASKNYARAPTFVSSGNTNLKIASRAILPRKPTPRNLKFKVSLSLLAGLLLAVCAVLFLEFREAIVARKEPGKEPDGI